VSQESQVLVVGEIVVDVSLGEGVQSESKLRLGGIVHACRTLWALGIPYSVAYVAPEYLVKTTEDFLYKHGAGEVRQLGTVAGSPNVVLIHNLQETVHQGYELLLRDQIEYTLDEQALGWIRGTNASDALLFPARFDIEPVFKALSDSTARVHADWANIEDNLSCLAHLRRPLTTLITSTSSSQFLHKHSGDPSLVINEALDGPAEAVVFKENRGGARYASKGGLNLEVGAQLRPVVHSVGVGDAFDAAFVVFLKEHGPYEALAYASWIAAEYASTTYPDDFKREVTRCRRIPPEEIVETVGIRLPWESRRQYNIYIAGPDFDYLDTTLIDTVYKSLQYHNFSPRRPIKENGQARLDSTDKERLQLFAADMELLGTCQLVIAMYEHDDPGTLVEIGLATGMGKPVLILDPQYRARSPMLLGTARKIVHSMDDLLVAVFSTLGQEVPVI
jgi:nucleoside 2-deoxyribosyltransferase